MTKANNTSKHCNKIIKLSPPVNSAKNSNVLRYKFHLNDDINKKIQDHLRLLEHSILCLECNSKNCQKMKVRQFNCRSFLFFFFFVFSLSLFFFLFVPRMVLGKIQMLISHRKSDKLKCRLCHRIDTMFDLHSKICLNPNCPLDACLKKRNLTEEMEHLQI